MIKVNILLETFEKYLQLNYDRSKQQSKAKHLPYTKNRTTTEALTAKSQCLAFCLEANSTSTQLVQKLQSDFYASCVEMIFDIDTTCVDVGFLTSVQLEQK